MPTRRFAGGEEIRKYIDILAKHYRLEDRAMFQSAGKTMTWESDHWSCEIIEHPKGRPEQTVKITADFAILGSGGFTYPKMPNVPGLETFKGQMLHTGRWNYDITGGSPAHPVLSKLTDKKVAVVGTGATAIQAVPEVAKYAAELYVFQRTPSAVDSRGNRDTTPEEWNNKIATKKGWQSERLSKLQRFTEQEHSLDEELADDGFSAMPSIRATFGGPSVVKPENVAEHLAELHARDDVRSDKVRARTKEIVKDPDTAEVMSFPIPSPMPSLHAIGSALYRVEASGA